MERNNNFIVSYYNNVFGQKHAHINIFAFLKAIKNEKFKDLINKIRNEPDKSKRNELKKNLPAITVSGTFKQPRKKENLLKHSGLIQIDIDNIKNVESVKFNLIFDPYTFAIFTSPSGNGLKLIFKIPPDPYRHELYFYAIEKYFKDLYDLEIDKACKDYTRLMFISSDKNIFVRPDSKIFNFMILNYTEKAIYNKPHFVRKNNNENYNPFEKLLNKIEIHKIDITAIYDDWIRIGYALATEFGETGRDYFHRISRFYPKYNQSETDKVFDFILRNNQKKVSLKTVFYIAKNYGVCLANC